MQTQHSKRHQIFFGGGADIKNLHTQNSYIFALYRLAKFHKDTMNGVKVGQAIEAFLLARKQKVQINLLI